MSRRRSFWRLSRFLLVSSTTACCALAAEIGARAIDGFAIVSFRLKAIRAPRIHSREIAADRRYAVSVPRIDSVNIGWYVERPRAAARIPLTPELEERAKRYETEPWSAFFEWNLEYLRHAVCGENRDVLMGTLEDFYYFEPTDGSIFPSYRHLRHVSPPNWFTTNAFGWRGPDIPLNKPPNTIRIAFVGASTTLDMFSLPFSHPEMIGYWLNRWAESRSLPYRFEVVNAGRTGINSNSIAAIVAAELMPIEPDLVVYYEGANQFWPQQLVAVDDRRRYDPPKTTDRRRTQVEDYSAIAQRALTVWDKLQSHGGYEPPKPRSRVVWPEGVDERDPRIDSPMLPMDLPNIVACLDLMRKALDGIGSELVLSSFMWIVNDGMRLDLTRDLTLYNYLNQVYWPMTYAQMRRLADFQNRVFEKYARVHGLPFIDMAAEFPQDPSLAIDAIHLRYEGLALQAWIYLQHLISIVEARVKDGRLPKPAHATRTVHSAFDQPSFRRVTMNELRQQCR